MTSQDHDVVRSIAVRAIRKHLDVDAAVIVEYPAIRPLILRGVPALEIVHELDELLGRFQRYC